MHTRAWPLEPNEIRAVFQRLRFEFCKWDLFHRGQANVLPDTLVLSHSEHQYLTRTASALWHALRELEQAVISSPEALAAVGVPDPLRPLITTGQPASPRLTRCDFHLAVGGRWMVTEFNEDGPGGFVESHGLNHVLADGFADRFTDLAFVGDIRSALVEAFAPWSRIGLVYPTAYADDLQQIALIADWLRASGHEAVTGSPANLVIEAGQARIFDQPIDALFRYFPGEWIEALPNFQSWSQASATLPMINNLAALVAQSKRFYAAAHEHPLALSAEAVAQIGQHMPASAYLKPELLEQLLAERERWVIKGAFGRMGDTVRLGTGCSQQQWADQLTVAVEKADQFAVQEYFDAVPMWFSNGLGYATIGVYLVDGRFAGYFSRVSPYPVINYDSAHVATMVEAA